MKKVLCVVLVLILAVSMSGCTLLNGGENAKNFYNKVSESKALLDLVATDVCAVLKDAEVNHLLTSDVNAAIEDAKNQHRDTIDQINELDTEICDLFAKAKKGIQGYDTRYYLKQVMSTYSEYKDSVLNANAAFDDYLGITWAKDSLGASLQELFVEL